MKPYSSVKNSPLKRLFTIISLLTLLLFLIAIIGYTYLFYIPIEPISINVGNSRVVGNTFLQPGTNTDNTILLEDGRYLGYAEYGDRTGFPILYFHGGQESRLSSAFMHTTAKEMGVRIISPDRPGIGLSSYQSGREFLDWPDDVKQLTEYLGLCQFSVFGLSGGAPHVLACLHSMPDRIVQATIVCGAAPYNYTGSMEGMWFPVRIFHWLASQENPNGLQKVIQMDFQDLMTKPEERIFQFQNYLPDPDKDIMNQYPEYGWGFIDGSQEAYAQGIDGVAQEWKLYVKDWGFELETIDHPINLWFGEEDIMAPQQRAIYLHDHLPQSNLHFLQNEGHFSLIRNHLAQILEELLLGASFNEKNLRSVDVNNE